MGQEQIVIIMEEKKTPNLGFPSCEGGNLTSVRLAMSLNSDYIYAPL